MLKFSSRFCYNNQLVTDIDTYMPAEMEKWGPKLIIYIRAMSPSSYVHTLTVEFG